MKKRLMDNDLLLKGIIKGFEDMGGKFIKVDDFDFFFEIKKGSQIDNEKNLKRAKKVFISQFGRGLRIRRVIV